ncbi:MAG: hypothetical protein JWN03_9085 [Nocardia sp.]|uniref:hypothetical protein n=1 Tax=Nocardia sp. TaxID=1821 RepID=UPI0026245F3C|nr:hypothetical protein [Nocardia sp.]MCU1648810.1 hypothetical protein [Nocardia sp.]
MGGPILWTGIPQRLTASDHRNRGYGGVDSPELLLGKLGSSYESGEIPYIRDDFDDRPVVCRSDFRELG